MPTLDKLCPRITVEVIAREEKVVVQDRAGRLLEAATTIGIPVGTAKSRLHYATDALRAALEADERGAEVGRALA